MCSNASRDSNHTNFGTVYHPLAIVNLRNKFEMRSFIHFNDDKNVPKFTVQRSLEMMPLNVG